MGENILKPTMKVTEGYATLYMIKSDKLGKAYFGSTFQQPPINRLKQHLTNYKMATRNHKRDYCSSYAILEQDDYQFIPLNDLGWIDRVEKERQEQILIEANRYIAVNVKNPFNPDIKQKLRQQKLNWAKQKVICKCGNEYTKAHIARHKRITCPFS